MMDLLYESILLFVGFVLLIKGADYFVEGSSAFAQRFHIPSMIIGLTIVAMGTSLPECAVSAMASLAGKNTLAIANVVGSNIFNLLVVCGFSALFISLPVSPKTLKGEFPFSLFCALALGILGFSHMILNRAEGVILLTMFVLYIIYMIVSASKARHEANDEYQDTVSISLWKCFIFIIGGMIAIKFGGDFVVDGATGIAYALGMSQNLIGLTIVALGTSLPELVTSIVAAQKGESDMALGNVIGSNIFNILFVLGIASSISPIAVVNENLIDIVILMVFSAVVLLIAFYQQKLDRKAGIIMLSLYTVYLIYIIMR